MPGPDLRLLEAGADRFGGEECTELLLELVAEGSVPDARIDVSARRILRITFELGLFDDPFVAVGAPTGRQPWHPSLDPPAGPVVRLSAEHVDAPRAPAPGCRRPAPQP